MADTQLRSENISVKTYSGCYGGETSGIGDIIVTQLKCPNFPHSLEKKQIIFVVDESGSMKESMPAVRASLLAARTAAVRLLHRTGSVLTVEQSDDIFTNCCNITLITFSDEAECKWESNPARRQQNLEPTGVTFTKAVENLTDQASTNMGAAIKLAFAKKLPGYATWIVILTDGNSNLGPCQSLESFRALMKEIPVHTKVVPLGYTSNFSPDILTALGPMTYLENEEIIADVLGGVMGEIVTCYGVDAKLILPSPETQSIDVNTPIMVPDVTEEQPRDVIGTKHIGCLFNDRVYTYGYLPWGNVQKTTFSRYHGLSGIIEYYDVKASCTRILPFNITAGEPTIPDEIKGQYFESAKGRILLRIYQAQQNGSFTHEFINLIKAKIADWKHPLAVPHKEQILRTLAAQPSRHNQCRSMGIVSSAQHQTNYTGGLYTTHTQRLASNIARTDYCAAMASDPVNQPQILTTPPSHPLTQTVSHVI